MASAEKQRLINTIGTIGKAATNALFKNDIEYYFLALSLNNSKGEVVDYFAFPILPDAISETHRELTNARKTLGGINVLKNPTFNTRTIALRGDFGKEFKLLLGGQNIEFAGFGLSIKNGKFDIAPTGQMDTTVPQFSSFAKTGYGCIKFLEAMKEKSKKLDDYNKPHSLYLYNPILGGNYQVEFESFVHAQDKDRYNMIPSYNITLMAVAPLDFVLSRNQNVKSAVKNIALSELQKKVNITAAPLRRAMTNLLG